jgi:hypothetical protein
MSKSFDRVDFLFKILKINMKTLNLASYGVKEMDETQMSEVNGGGWGVVIGLIALGVYLYDNWDSFVEGVEEGYEAVRG